MIKDRYFYLYLKNPLKTYYKIKKYFRPLKIKISTALCKYKDAKILDICSFDVSWKEKWYSPRHEQNPRIHISIFNFVHIFINFTLGDEESLSDMAYWEAALYWLYYNKSLSESVKQSTGWTQYNKDTDKEEPIELKVLKEPYHTMYINNKLPEIYYDNTTR